MQTGLPPTGTFASFKEAVAAAVKRFAANPFIERLNSAGLSIADYHRYLLTIFWQTYESPATFALAGARCESGHDGVRDYLIRHAGEEHSHWRWVLEDLAATGYTGPDPRGGYPTPACERYIAYNFYFAFRYPIGRLGVAAYLEGIGAAYGKPCALQLARTLYLGSGQMRFLLGHGDTDVGHTQDIYDTLAAAELTASDWARLAHAAEAASSSYEAMYAEMLAQSQGAPTDLHTNDGAALAQQ